jgi:hypothetical protein
MGSAAVRGFIFPAAEFFQSECWRGVRAQRLYRRTQLGRGVFKPQQIVGQSELLVKEFRVLGCERIG